MSDFVLLAWSFSIFSFRIILQKKGKPAGQFARRNKVLYKIENWKPQYFHGKYIYHKQHHCQFLLRRVRKTLHLTIIRDSERKGNNFS